MYRGSYKPDEAAQKYADEVSRAIEFSTSGKVALYMAEAIQGVGGLVP